MIEVIDGVWHCALMNGSDHIAFEQIQVMKRFPWLECTVSITGPHMARRGVMWELNKANIGWDLGHESPRTDEYEFPAMRLVQEMAKSTYIDAIFYWHTKGAAHPQDERRGKWRQAMTAELLFKFKECRDYLQDHDVVGVNWERGHFPGNFWFARTDFLRRLPDFDTFRSRPLPWLWHERGYAEFWLQFGNPRVKSLVMQGEAWENSQRFWEWVESGSAMFHSVMSNGQ